MSESLISIEAHERKESGKSYARKLRKAGKIPANLMEKGKSTLLELDPKWLHRAYQGERKFELVLNGVSRLVRIQEVQVHAVKRFPIHVDLMPV